MEILTEKQIKARAYYAANAEKIKQQKRDQYWSGGRERKLKPITEKPKLSRPNLKREAKPKPVAHIDRRLTARERIENMKIDREAFSE